MFFNRREHRCLSRREHKIIKRFLVWVSQEVFYTFNWGRHIRVVDSEGSNECLVWKPCGGVTMCSVFTRVLFWSSGGIKHMITQTIWFWNLQDHDKSYSRCAASSHDLTKPNICSKVRSDHYDVVFHKLYCKPLQHMIPTCSGIFGVMCFEEEHTFWDKKERGTYSNEPCMILNLKLSFVW